MADSRGPVSNDAAVETDIPNITGSKAPLVDSTLLRFLSAQKVVVRDDDNADVQEVALPDVAAAEDPVVVDEKSKQIEAIRGGPSEANANEATVGRQQQQQKQPAVEGISPGDNIKNGSSVSNDDDVLPDGDRYDEAEAAQTTAAASATALGELAGATARWLDQYNAGQISQKLISIGAEEDAAIEAGRAVQRYALNQTTRRRVQRFLRERDRVWTNNSGGGTTGEVSSSADAAQQMQTKSSARSVPNDEGIVGSIAAKADITTAQSQPSSGGIDAVVNVLTSAGLTGKDVAAVFTHTPSVATMAAGATDETVLVEHNDDDNDPTVPSSSGNTLKEMLDVTYSNFLCGSLCLRRYDARKVLRTCPGLLTRQGSESAREVVSLMSSLGVSASSLAREKTSLPRLLSRSPAAIFRLAVFLSSDSVRMRTKHIGSFIRRPDCSSLLDVVAPPTALNRLFSVEVSDDSYDSRQNSDQAYRKMEDTAAALSRGVGVRDLATMIAANPSVLLLEVPQIMPIVEFLREIGIDEEDVAMVLQSYPALAEADLIQMQRVVTYMRSLGVADAALGGIFRAFPSLFSLDVEKEMMPVVSFLRSIGVVNVGRFVT